MPAILTAAASSLRQYVPRDRRFRLLLTALATSSAGDWIYNTALLAFVAARGGAAWLGIVTAARALPIVVLGPLGGVLADRHDRRRLMYGSDLVRAMTMGALTVVALAGLPLWLTAVIAALATAAGSAHPACVATSTPRLVSEADLARANASRAAVGQSAIVVGPALGALLLVFASPAAAFAINAATFVASAVAIAAIRSDSAFAPSAHDADAKPDTRAELRAAVDALRAAPEALRLVAADLTCSAVYGAESVLLVIVGHRVGAGAAGYGILLGAYGLGGVLGALLAGRSQSSWRRVLAAGLLALALPLPLLGITTWLPAAAALAFCGGLGGVVAEVLGDTVLQRVLPEHVLGRAFGLVIPLSLSGIVLGALIAGPLYLMLGLPGAMTAIGAAVLVVLVWISAPRSGLVAARVAC